MSFVEDAQTNPDDPHNGIVLGYTLHLPELMLELGYDEFNIWLNRHMEQQAHEIRNAAMDKYFERQGIYQPLTRTEFTGM